MKHVRALVVFLALAVVMAACGSDDSGDGDATESDGSAAAPTGSEPAGDDGSTDDESDPVADAEPTEEASGDLEEELVVMCTVQEEWCEAAVAAFADQTGVRTEFIGLSTGEGVARLELEEDDPSVDVWFGGPSVGPATAAGNGSIEQYVSPNADVIEEKAEDGTWTGIYIGALGFCSNTEALADAGVDAPASYDDLLDPAFKDEIAMADQRTSGTASTAAANLVALRGSEDAAIDYLKELHENIFQYTASGSAPGRMAAQGEVLTSIIFAHDCLSFELETGVDLTPSFPEEGTGFEIGQVSLIANAKNPNAAKAFIDWALTAEAQELAATVNQFQIPTHPDASVPEQAISLDDLTLAEGYSADLAEDLRGGDFPDRFGDQVRDGEAEPADE